MSLAPLASTPFAPKPSVGTPPDPLGAAALRGDGTVTNGLTEKSNLRKVAEGFEALFLRQMLSAASKSDFGGEDLFGDKGDDTFTEMRDAQFAEIASESGTLGIADMLEAQLARQIGPSTPANPAEMNIGGNNGL